MAISASGKGGALIRVDPADCDTLAETATVTVAIMGGREMPGWLRVSSDDLETDEQLTQWISRAVSYARSPAAQMLAPAGRSALVRLPVSSRVRSRGRIRADVLPSRRAGQRDHPAPYLTNRAVLPVWRAAGLVTGGSRAAAGNQ